ncbi:MAG: permease prefix domain 1-containing protein [Eubacterium sp.]|nr:permease prefix domain 1-containing protein [Eubacterium sp.]
MNKSEYIKEVLSNIQGKAYLNEIKTELENHIEDRQEYYTNIGYDSSTAEQKAVEHMGDAEDIGEEMNMLYYYKKHKIISIIGLIILTVILSYLWFLSIIFREVSSILSFDLHVSAFFLIILCVSYRCTLHSRGRVAMLWQAVISFGMFCYINFDSFWDLLIDMFISTSSIAAVTFFIHGIMCLTCTAELHSAIKGNQNSAIMKRYKVWEKIFYVLTAICTFISITKIINIIISI